TPDPNVDSSVPTAWSHLCHKPKLVEELRGQALELTPVDAVDVIEITVQIVDIALIDESPIERFKRLVFEEATKLRHVLPRNVPVLPVGRCMLHQSEVV